MRTLIFSTLLAAGAMMPASAQTTPEQPQAAHSDVSVNVQDTYYLGQTPAIAIMGLSPGERVSVHLFRVIDRWLPDGNGGWRREPTPMQGWARYRADASGRIDLTDAIPEDGTSTAVGPATLFWSARRTSDPLLNEQRFARNGVSLRDDGSYIVRVTGVKKWSRKDAFALTLSART